MTISLSHDALSRALAEVRSGRGLLAHTGDEAVETVHGLGGSWRGAAAASFRAAFDDWTTAAQACLSGLDDLAGALVAAQADLTASDADTARRLGLTEAGLG